MLYWLIPLVILLTASLLVFAVMCICFFKIFYSSRGKTPNLEEDPLPASEAYAPYREEIIRWIREIRTMEHTDVSIQSFDGLTLCGKFYEYQKGAPIEIMFHGYKSTAERDLCGGVFRCFELGHSALIVDHRAGGSSQGHVITFGAKERLDCLAWVDFVIEHISLDAKIILTGISMGAATVMMASSMELPKNVIGVLADCGYTSTRDIVKKVMRDMKLPADLLYPFARWSAKLFGRFDPDEASPIRSMNCCHLPIIFFHGDSDGYVPCQMSEENYAACASEQKRLVITPGADHGLCFPANKKAYLEAMKEFFAPVIGTL